MFSAQDEAYMRRALRLASMGMGFTSPNPLVGAVVVRYDEQGAGHVIGEGYHRRFGQLHAERNALASCTEDPHGATIYVTLEPCCHQGKTPPCTEALIESGVSRVVIGSSDPNPLVAGKGVAMLREHGVTVEGCLCEEEALELNEPFFHYITTGKPLVVLKYAMTMDGKIATRNGESRWITGEAARRNVHMDRLRYSAIMVGMGTVVADDPLLTCRLESFGDTVAGGVSFADEFPQGTRNPIRVICDSKLAIDPTRKVVSTTDQARTIIATCSDDADKAKVLEDAGCEIVKLPAVPSSNPEGPGHVDLRALVEKLGDMGIDSLVIEGGASMSWSALGSQIVDKVQAYISPKIFGGITAPGPVGGRGIIHPSECIHLVNPKLSSYGEDILVESGVEYCSQE